MRCVFVDPELRIDEDTPDRIDRELRIDKDTRDRADPEDRIERGTGDRGARELESAKVPGTPRKA